MTMAKKLPILSPSIHTFELLGEYSDYKSKAHIFESIKKLVDKGDYRQIHYGGKPENYYIYKKLDGGLTIRLSSCPERRKNYIRLSGINLARIAGEPSRLTLTNLSLRGLACQEEIFLNELESLGILDVEDSIKWKMKRVDITQDFYVKADPTLPIKVVRYAGKVEPHGKGREKHHDQHNEMRSATYEKEKYNFELYDKHDQLSAEEEKGYPIRSEDIAVSKNLVRYEVQLKRKYLKNFEDQNLNGMKISLRNHALFSYFEALRELIPEILYECARKMFGVHPWYPVSGALKQLEKSDLDKKTKKLVRSYIETADYVGNRQVKYSGRKKQKIKEALDILEINTVIIPDEILNKRQYARFPLAPICSRVQGIDNQSTDELYG